MNLTLGDLGGAVGGIDQDIATFGTECGGNSLSKSVNTLEEAGTSFNAKLDLLVAVSEGTAKRFGMDGTRCQLQNKMIPRVIVNPTHLVSKTLLLEVQC